MDSTSIITQVSRDEETLTTFPPEKGELRVCEQKIFVAWLGEYNSAKLEQEQMAIQHAICCSF